MGFVNPCPSWLGSWVGVFGLGLWCCPSFAGCLWCSLLGFGVGLLSGCVWFRARFPCPPPFPVPVCRVGVRAGPGSRLGPSPLGWVVGVCFLRFFFPVVGCPCPGHCGLSPHLLSFGLGCWLFFLLLPFVCLFRCPSTRWAAVPGLVLPVLAGSSPWACLGVLPSVPSGWGVWPPSVLLAGGLVAVGCFRAAPRCPPPFFWGRGGGLAVPPFAFPRLALALWLVCGVVGPSPLLAEVPVCYSPPILAGFRCRWWWAVPTTPGPGLLAAVVCGVWCVAVVCWWGCGWCVVWLVPRHSWRRFLCATPRHSWLGFAAGGGGRSPPLLAGVCWRRCCVVCGGGVLVGLWLVCGVVGPSPLLAEVPVCYSPPLLAGFRCRWWWAVPATPGWGPFAALLCGVWCVAVVCWWGCGWCVVWLVPRHSWRRFLCATPRHSWLGFVAGGGGRSPPLLAGVRLRRWCVVCGVWCVVCGGGVLLGLWLACGVVGPSQLLAEVPVCYSPPLLAGLRCRWWWAVPATPGWGPLAAVVCGVWCVVCGGGVLLGLWSVCGVVGPLQLLAEVPVCYSPPLLAGSRCRWWWAVPATPGWGPLAAVVCGVWCVVCWWGPLPLLAEVPVCYSPPLLAGFRCRWWWAVPATPGWGPLAAVVCVLCLAGSGGPASRARSGAPHLFLWPLCLSALLGPLRAGVAPLLFRCCCRSSLVVFLRLPLPGSTCARASFVSPAWPLAGLWWLPPRPQPPFMSRGFRRSCLVPWCLFLLFFLPLLLPPCAPVVSGFPWFPASGALGLGACVVCFVGLPLLGSPCACLSFVLSALLLAAPAWLMPPPPSCLAVLVPVARCCVPCCAVRPWVRCCAALLRVVSPGVVLSCAVLRSFGAAVCCAVPSGAARRPGALCSAALCVAVFPRAVCSVLCVFCCGAVVRAVVRRPALCCVCLGVLCCAFPVLSVLCGAVLRCAGALALCCLCGACCCWRLVLWCAAVCCAVSCGVPWCGAGSGGPLLSAGGVFRCRCPCLAAWSAFLWLVWFAVVPCFPVSCCVVLCCRVVLCCCALLSCCGAVGACFALLWSRAVLCCAVGWLCCFWPGGGVCLLWCSFPRAVRSLSSPLCALRCLVVLAVVPCFPVSCAVALCCRVVLCCRALLSFCGAVCVCFALLRPVVRRQCGQRCCWCLVLWRVPVRCGVSLGVLRCGCAALVCRGVLLCCALSCGVLRPVPCPAVPCCPRFSALLVFVVPFVLFSFAKNPCRFSVPLKTF